MAGNDKNAKCYIVTWEGMNCVYASQPLTEEEAYNFCANLVVECYPQAGLMTTVNADMLTQKTQKEQ